MSRCRLFIAKVSRVSDAGASGSLIRFAAQVSRYANLSVKQEGCSGKLVRRVRKLCIL